MVVLDVINRMEENMLLEEALLILLFCYITGFLLFGLAKGRKYFKSYYSRKSSGDYLFHSIDVTLTLAGLSMTALALIVGLGFEHLERMSSIILFFSISFVALALSSNVARFPRRSYTFIADVLADVGILGIGCGFLAFFEKELPSFYGLKIVYSIFIIVFMILTSLELFKYYRYWSIYDDQISEDAKKA
jgi:hypothetical protein